MNIIIVMIPLSFIILLGAAAAFFWAVNNDQFDDMDSPGALPMDDDLTDEGVEEGDPGHSIEIPEKYK